MLSKNKNTTSGTQTKIGTIIGPNATFDGNLTANDIVRVDGTLNGNCNCNNNLIVGQDGRIIGDVFADNVVISGNVKGNITAKGKLELYSTGRIVGDVIAKSLVIDENAYFEGRCTMTTSDNTTDNLAKDVSNKGQISESPEENEQI